MTEVPTPRLKNGGKLYWLGEGYYVLTDENRRETSNRVDGRMFIGWEIPNEAVCVLVPYDQGDGQIKVRLYAEARSAWIAWILDGDQTIRRKAVHAHPGDTIDLHDEVWERMA